MTAYTKKQGQYLAFIYRYTQLNGRPPAEADMQRYFKASPPSVHQMVLKLDELGLISRIPRTPRSIQVLAPTDRIPELGEPVAGVVNLPTLTWSQDGYIKAYRFAAEAHQGQTLPGIDLPYLVHVSLVCMEVTACLTLETEHNGDLAVQCALLHDVIEDTAVTYPDVEAAFGKQVAQGVLALTKDDALPPAERMTDSLRRIRQQPVEIWLVKLADRITNLGLPPRHWTQSRIREYRDEAIQIHLALRDASEVLSRRLERKIVEYNQYY